MLAPELGRLWLQQAWFWVGCGSFLHFRAFALAFRLVAIALIITFSPVMIVSISRLLWCFAF